MSTRQTPCRPRPFFLPFVWWPVVCRMGRRRQEQKNKRGGKSSQPQRPAPTYAFDPQIPSAFDRSTSTSIHRPGPPIHRPRLPRPPKNLDFWVLATPPLDRRTSTSVVEARPETTTRTHTQTNKPPASAPPYIPRRGIPNPAHGPHPWCHELGNRWRRPNARAQLFGSTFFKAPNPTRQAGRGGSCASLKSNVRVVESINADTSQHIWAPIGGQRGHARLSAAAGRRPDFMSHRQIHPWFHGWPFWAAPSAARARSPHGWPWIDSMGVRGMAR